MTGYVQDFNLVVVFFVYGLAFFVMGLAMMFEARRSPLLAEASVLTPLAVFGFVHGAHEWFDMSLIVREWFGYPVLGSLSWIRLGFLLVSFSALLLYGLQVLKPDERSLSWREAVGGVTLLLLYIMLVLVTSIRHQGTSTHWVEHADALSRYLIAVPGAVIAALALERQGRSAYRRGRRRLGGSLRIAAVSFGIYSLTQLVVSPSDLLPARYLNAALFIEWTGVPVQAVRAVLAGAITFGLVRASQAVERERQEQFLEAKNDRIEALQRVQTELLEREALRKEYLRQTVIAQEEERARVARELHDETAQFLTALTLNLATLKRKISPDPDLEKILEQLQTLSGQMSRGIYRMVRDLRPAQLDDLGLGAALRYLADDAMRRSGVRANLHFQGEQRRLDPLVETVIFRVAQESLTNVIRHAQCDVCEMTIEFQDDFVKLSVKDEGIGFDPDLVGDPQRGLGIAGIRERVDSVGGKLVVDAQPSKGSLVTVTIPVNNNVEPIIEEQAHAYDKVDAS